MGNRPSDGVSKLNPLAEVRQTSMAGIIWDEGFQHRCPRRRDDRRRKQFVAGLTLGATNG